VNKPLARYRYNRYSQNGEDGVIEEICRRLSITAGWSVEFGAWDGRHLSNTFNLVAHQNWQGVFLEMDPARYESLLVTKSAFPGRFHTLCARVGWEGEDRLDHLLAQTPLPADFELLSIDIDSYDYEVWNSLENYRPKIVLIESNVQFRPGVFQRHNPPHAIAASFSSLVELGRVKGYQLVCHTGNCIFVENGLVPPLQLDPVILKHPERSFDYAKHIREIVRIRANSILPTRVMRWLYSLSNQRKQLFRKR
jgi:hypothetical protein